MTPIISISTVNYMSIEIKSQIIRNFAYLRMFDD